MKFIGRLVYGLLVLMIGYTVYGFSAIDMQSRHIVKYGDIAVGEGEYEYFQQISRYYYKDAHFSENITTPQGSFNLSFFVINYEKENYVMMLVDALEGYEEKHGLRYEFYFDNPTDDKADLVSYSINVDNNLSKKWYLTTLDAVKLYETQEALIDIVDVKLYLVGEEPKDKETERVDTLLYDYDETAGSFLDKDYLDLYGKRVDTEGKALTTEALNAIGIYESKGHSYVEFQGLLWRNLGVYVVLVIIITYLLFFRNRDRFGNKKPFKFGPSRVVQPKASKAKSNVVVEKQPVVKENFNSKSLSEPVKEDNTEKK